MSDNKGGNAIERYLQVRGRKTIDSEQRTRIDTWLRWYRGQVDKFHKYSVYTGQKRHTCERYKLGMGKQVCEDFATLLLNEKVQINATSFAELPAILEANNFLDRCNRLLELTMALGTGALVEFLDADKKPVIDYIRGDMIYPLNWDGDNITECAFGSVRVYDVGGKPKKGFY
ncbi:MAG: phage portal protein, partial [Veillonellaceae bacterium]|nr:phage portal protein [Veillonellaceae bacterium]